MRQHLISWLALGMTIAQLGRRVDLAIMPVDEMSASTIQWTAVTKVNPDHINCTLLDILEMSSHGHNGRSGVHDVFGLRTTAARLPQKRWWTGTSSNMFE